MNRYDIAKIEEGKSLEDTLFPDGCYKFALNKKDDEDQTAAVAIMINPDYYDELTGMDSKVNNLLMAFIMDDLEMYEAIRKVAEKIGNLVDHDNMDCEQCPSKDECKPEVKAQHMAKIKESNHEEEED